MDLSSVTMICRDEMLDNQVVSDKDFLYVYNLKEWQLDKMKEFGLKKGYFKWKSYCYQLFVDGKKIKQYQGTDRIKLPQVKKSGRKVRFIFTDIVKAENIPASNKYITYMTIYGEKMLRSEFERRVGISESKLRKETTGSASFKINGIDVKVSRPKKVPLMYKVKNSQTRHISLSLPPNKVIKNTRCNKEDLSRLTKVKDVLIHKNYTIERIS